MKGSAPVLALLALTCAAAAQVNPGGKITETKDGVVFQKNTPTPWPTPSRPDRSADSGGGLVTITLRETDRRVAYEGLTLLVPPDSRVGVRSLSVSIPFGTHTLVVSAA